MQFVAMNSSLNLQVERKRTGYTHGCQVGVIETTSVMSQVVTNLVVTNLDHLIIWVKMQASIIKKNIYIYIFLNVTSKCKPTQH